MLYFNLCQETRNFFAPDGISAQNLPGYEYRPGQEAMAQAVAQALEEEGPGEEPGQTARKLVVEAETGIGKTLAYLVPAVLSGQKIIISTNTLNLQDQILNKEIPFIRETMTPDLTALCVKGRRNYLCLYRWKQLYTSPQLNLFERGEDIRALEEWLQETQTGDRAELDWLADHAPLWYEISADSSQCLGPNCPEGEACFLNRLRKKAARAQLLIVNHHLFFSDLALRRSGFAEVLPRYQSVIFDEAHHLENIATRYFGVSFSHYQVIDLARDIDRLALEKNEQKVNKTGQAARALAAQADHFVTIFPREPGRFPLLEALAQAPDWEKELSALKERFVSLLERLEIMSQVNDIWNNLLRRCHELLANLSATAEGRRSGYVYWFERRQKTISLSASPIEIASDLQEFLYLQIRSIVFTSATLTAGGKFAYFFKRLGLDDDTETLRLPTPFDYLTRTRLYVPEDGFPQPAQPGYPRATQERITDILRLTRGRALVLFTSIKAMEKMYEHLRENLDYPLLMQGTGPRAVLLEQFRNDTHSVLLAVASFWEGVSVPGETLSCVIIDKLPFEVPSDPVIMARISRIREEGGNPFFDFQTPRAILTLRQGIGRLMRCATDRGLLAIMDVRLFTKQYGRLFLKSLPDSPIIRDLAEAEMFLNHENGG